MLERIVRIKYYLPTRFVGALRPAYHFCFALGAAFWYRFPSRHIAVIGVTGTKGKTTTAELIHTIFSVNGTKVAALTTVDQKIGSVVTPNPLKMTMPGRFAVQKFLREAVRAGCQYAILEVTSEGVKQFRHRFIRFRAGVMTNIAPEHIESHGSFEKYLRAKLDLFYRLPADGIAVMNASDQFSTRFRAATRARKTYYTKEEIKTPDRVYPIQDFSVTKKGISFECGDVVLRSPLLGEFNAMNILAAISLAASQHVSWEHIQEGLRAVKGIPGRLEMMQTAPFGVMVDYAHTPDSLEKLFSLAKNFTPRGRLICVFGTSGGGRDTWKRKEMGKIAAAYCHEVVLTNEDSYDEDTETILHDIAAGFPDVFLQKGRVLKMIIDRREGIAEGLRDARKGDLVLVTGKGTEPWMIGLRGSKIPWDDRRVVREELEKLTHTHE